MYSFKTANFNIVYSVSNYATYITITFVKKNVIKCSNYVKVFQNEN